MKALILAGGLGKRMQPYSFVVPKPLLPLPNQKPILENLLEHLHSQNIKDITISLGYGADLIKAFCQTKKWNVKFVEEKEPLGTAGSIKLVDFNEPLLVINGDIVTKCNFKDMFKQHKTHVLTIGVKQVEYTLPFGIIESDKYIYVREKPIFTYTITCGIYIVEPLVKQYINGRIDFPELIQKVVTKKEINLYNIRQYWNAVEKPNQLLEEDFKCESIIRNYNLKSVKEK